MTGPTMPAEILAGAALVTLTILVTIGVLLPIALVVHLRAPSMRPAVSALTLVPWVVPPAALAVALLASHEVTASWLAANRVAIALFYALWAMPFAYRSLDARLARIDARSLYESARALGASVRTALVDVVLVNLRPAIAAAAALTAVVVGGEFAFVTIVTGGALPGIVGARPGEDPRRGAVAAVVVVLLTAVAYRLAHRAALDRARARRPRRSAP